MVHPSVPGNPPTLLDGLQALCAYELVCGGQLSLINRLDRETSGIVLVAKHRAAART
jgi:23S rRNA pseudouridine1911/1915/1917 synthase